MDTNYGFHELFLKYLTLIIMALITFRMEINVLFK
jgi:hypothetical protein